MLRVPPPAPVRRDAVIAVCISGQVREFTQPQVCINIYAAMVEPIQNISDVFAALDATNDKAAAPQRGTAPPSVPLARRCMALLNPASVTWAHFDASHNRTGCDPMRNSVPTGSGQAFNNARCHRQMERQEALNGRRYEWVLRLRPDVVYARRLPDERWMVAAMR
eukprot:7367543-Prymnesium_polylepis.1